MIAILPTLLDMIASNGAAKEMDSNNLYFTWVALVMNEHNESQHRHQREPNTANIFGREIHFSFIRRRHHQDHPRHFTVQLNSSPIGQGRFPWTKKRVTVQQSDLWPFASFGSIPDHFLTTWHPIDACEERSASLVSPFRKALIAFICKHYVFRYILYFYSFSVIRLTFASIDEKI